MAALRSKSWLKLFEAFLEDVRIASKESASTDERGDKLVMWESQRRFVKEIGDGLDRGVHVFNCLKCAQAGITTISLSLDAFWFAVHPNLIGCLVTDDEHKRDANRDFLTKQIESFPDGYFGERFRIIKNNRTALHFSNGGRLDLLVAGTKKKSLSWAEGVGYGFGHTTERAKYGDPQGIKSLEERFAQTNPHRLYINESTADGFNHWRTKWQNGLTDPTQRSFFIGWWSVDTNRVDRRDPRFKVYGLYPESAEERENIILVAQLHGHRVTPEQLAWYRWKQSGAGAEQGLLDQNQPWTAEQAFVQTGYSFFQSRVLGGDIKALMDGRIPYEGYRYEVSNDFFGFRMHHLDASQGDKEEDVELKIYEEPVDGAQYVIGCDPAYGRNEHKDHHCLSVFRCFADRLVQVAEFVTCDIETKHFAWVIFHMCAAYRNCMCNVELGGPGRLIMAEFDHLRQLLGAEMNAGRVEARGWQDAAANARWYLYHKVDSPGAGYMHNFETNWRTKDELMHGYRGVYSSREITIRSVSLLYEMNNVVVVDGNIGAPESTDENMKDDRVFAAALATRAWSDWVRKQQITEGLTYDVVMQAEQAEKLTPYQSKVGSIVANFLRSAEEQANEEPEPPAWLQNQGLA